MCLRKKLFEKRPVHGCLAFNQTECCKPQYNQKREMKKGNENMGQISTRVERAEMLMPAEKRVVL